MKKFLIKIAIFGVLLFGIDRLAGYAFAYMSENSKGGYTGHYHYMVDKCNEDVLIFGSSRAIHHYNPRIISDSLDLSCYNCGQDGNGIILFYGMWKIINKRYRPKMIIYDVFDAFDLLVADDNHKYLGWLKESYQDKDVKAIFLDIDTKEQYKMMSYMYRYNSKWHQIAADYVYPLYVVKDNGFFPLEGEIDPLRVRKEVNLKSKYKFDQVKIDYLNRLVENLGDTKIIFVVSPTIYGLNTERLKPIKDICKHHNVPFYDFSNNSKYVNNAVYFSDGAHMNAKGANEFTKELIHTMHLK